MDFDSYGENYPVLTDFVHEECDRRLRAYSAQPRDAAEHSETENEVLSGGYAYRQLYELIQNAADAVTATGDATGRIHIKLSPDRLEAANSGAALDGDGIVALLNARSSTKRGNQIGRFGIGFKSLLKLGGSESGTAGHRSGMTALIARISPCCVALGDTEGRNRHGGCMP